MSRNTLFSFVDPKDPFMPSGVAGEELLGPVLSVMGSRLFASLFLFHTPHTRAHAEATVRELLRRHPQCHVEVCELPVSDPKDYSSLMGSLAREVRRIVRAGRAEDAHICVSSGTAEMRAAWFLLSAVGVLPATLLQVGSPAQPLFGPANVNEVQFDEWGSLRDLVMPLEYFLGSEGSPVPAPLAAPRAPSRWLGRGRARLSDVTAALAAAAPAPEPAPSRFDALDNALRELDLFIGSASMRQAAERAAIAAPTDVAVLLLGETGTGKELFAKLVHRLSSRHERRMVAVNCAAIPTELVESELFGHMKGAFTGAASDRAGRFEQADGGTLFLDEIAELPPAIQAKLLRVLQDGVVEPLGAAKPRQVSVRIIAATNRNLLREVAAGRFREDLYYRLEVVHIELPPLRDRRGEIAELAVALLKKINDRRSRPLQFSKEALLRLEQHHWPGNVRELSNVLNRSAIYAGCDVLLPEDLVIEPAPAADPYASLPDPHAGFSLEQFLAAARKQLVLRALEKTAGNQSAAADLLGISKQAVSKFVQGQAGSEG